MKLFKRVQSCDSTIKYFFKCDNNEEQSIESCLLYLEKHGTILCISSQFGCIQKCRFCAAGNLPFYRNLSVAEILFQVEYMINDEPSHFKDIFQITFMGSGEPFQNLSNILFSSELFFKKYSKLKKINISTIVPFIDVDIAGFIQFKDRMHIQYSLHFTDSNKRNEYFNWELPTIENSIALLNNISKEINDEYSVNYILFEGLNDTIKEADSLIDIIKKSTGYLKISELSPVRNSHFVSSRNEECFIERIKNASIKFEKFISKGTDINAGCGQFYNESIV